MPISELNKTMKKGMNSNSLSNSVISDSSKGLSHQSSLSSINSVVENPQSTGTYQLPTNDTDNAEYPSKSSISVKRNICYYKRK
jgi:hypothetical protein